MASISTTVIKHRNMKQTTLFQHMFILEVPFVSNGHKNINEESWHIFVLIDDILNDDKAVVNKSILALHTDILTNDPTSYSKTGNKKGYTDKTELLV